MAQGNMSHSSNILSYNFLHVSEVRGCWSSFLFHCHTAPSTQSRVSRVRSDSQLNMKRLQHFQSAVTFCSTCSIFMAKCVVGWVQRFCPDSVLEPAGTKPFRDWLLSRITGLAPVEVEAEVGDGAEKLTLGQCGPHVDISIRWTIQLKSIISYIVQSFIAYIWLSWELWDIFNYEKKYYHGISNTPADHLY